MKIDIYGDYLEVVWRIFPFGYVTLGIFYYLNQSINHGLLPPITPSIPHIIHLGPDTRVGKSHHQTLVTVPREPGPGERVGVAPRDGKRDEVILERDRDGGVHSVGRAVEESVGDVGAVETRRVGKDVVVRQVALGLGEVRRRAGEEGVRVHLRGACELRLVLVPSVQIVRVDVREQRVQGRL